MKTTEDTPQPRSHRRLMYTSDPSNLAFYQSGKHIGVIREPAQARDDPARAEDLVHWVDELANNGIDSYAQTVFAQGWSVLFRSEHLEYDARPYHQRFVPMMDAGVTPLETLIDQAHSLGMEFIAKFRMNDRHGHGEQGARFILDNGQWQLEDFPGGLDYSFSEVRDFVFSAADEVVRRFDVDGLLFNYIRHMHCFPTDVARERHPVMTDFLARAREMLERVGREKGKRLTLGVMVPQTLAECHDLGYDVPTWIREGLIDYVCPCDFGYADFNAPFEEFAEITRGSTCYLYPSLSPMLCRGDEVTLLTPESYRALAQNFYGAGADGISVFNYQYHWARLGGTARYPGPVDGYPIALSYLSELKSPRFIERHPRHYRFHPLWGGPSQSGAIKNDRIVLERRSGAHGEYRFRIAERFKYGTRSTLYFTAQGLLPDDGIRVEINGAEVSGLRRGFHAEGRLKQNGRSLPPFSTGIVDLMDLPLTGRDNYLAVTLTSSAPGAEGDITIDEVEVVVLPPILSDN